MNEFYTSSVFKRFLPRYLFIYTQYYTYMYHGVHLKGGLGSTQDILWDLNTSDSNQ